MTLNPARAFQGAWVIRGAQGLGSIQAWSVQGDTVMVYDAASGRTTHESFTVVSPCRISRTRLLPDGNRVVTEDTFVFADDGLYVTLAPANGGFLRNGVVTACVGSSVYAYDTRSKVCRVWDGIHGDPIELADAECRITGDDAARYFSVRALSGGYTVFIGLYGRALLSPELLAYRAERWSSFSDAVGRAATLCAERAKGNGPSGFRDGSNRHSPA